MVALLPVLLLAAQAEGPRTGQPGSERAQIFIAPSGEPFRVTGNAAYPVRLWFSGADENGDGKLDLNEFTVDFMRFFDQLDVNHDGAIDSVERARYETQVAPETLGGSSVRESQGQDDSDVDVAGQGSMGSDTGPTSQAKAKPRYGSNPIGAARFDLLGLPEPVAAMDAELRGRISRRVAQQAAQDRFALLDEVHRGYLTLDGLPPTFAQHGGGRKRG
jgi:hypothetical protein